MDVLTFKDGGYRFIKAGFQFSSGVAAESGFEIERARLARPLPLAAGLAAVESHLAGLGRPSTAFAACELRSPEPFSEQGFDDFNREYVKTLTRWGIFKNEVNRYHGRNVRERGLAPEGQALPRSFEAGGAAFHELDTGVVQLPVLGFPE